MIRCDRKLIEYQPVRKLRCHFLDMIRLNPARYSAAFNSPKKPIYRPKQQTDRRRKPAWGREDGLLWAPEYAPKYASPTELNLNDKNTFCLLLLKILFLFLFCIFHANTLGEMLIRQDCMRRRQVINIPEFYAGSILQKVRENNKAFKL